MTAVGFRVKSGFAIAVVLDGPRSAPRAIARRVVELSDPEVAESRQPYHDGFYQTEENEREIARRVTIVKRCAKRSVGALVDDVLRATHPPARGAAVPAERSVERRGSPRAALVVGSLIDPETIGNPHIRAHAYEGRLFRTVLEDALRAHGIECDVVVDKQLAAHAAKALDRPTSAITRTIVAIGKSLGGSWRAEEKAAATAAWIALRP